MAGRFPRAWLDELRARADIVQVVSAYVPLKKNGRKYWGLCPFHQEKTASFSVDPDRQMYYCFGCKANGGAINFIMDIERLEFPEAVKLLADRLHIPLPELVDDPRWQEKRDARERLLQANLEAARFYHQTLFTDAGRAALDYLKGRGLSDAVIRRFGLGAAPDRWDALTRHLEDMGWTEAELQEAGLTVVREAEEADGEHPARPRRAFDMFRNRAIFPIIDQHGNVLAFGGRILGKGQPKYLNTSDTPVFNKRQGVYAANLLRKERGLDRVVLVEGYMDVVSLAQFGVRGVCATLGTALTPEQARLLRRFAPAVYLAYDGDSAGQHAILRGLDILQAEGVPARVLDFPDGLDPDEFIRRDGAEGFAALPALTPESYRMRRLRDEYDLTTQDGRTEYAKACAAILRGVEPVEMENYLQELSLQTGFTRDVLLAQIGRTAPRPAQTAAPARQTRPVPLSGAEVSESVRAQETFLGLFAGGRLPRDIASMEDFSDPLLKDMYAALLGGASPVSLVEESTDEAARARISRILFAPQPESTDDLLQMAKECMNAIRRQQISARIDRIQEQVNALTGAEKAAALREYQALNAELARLKANAGRTKPSV